ncbi:hypothetical protein R2F25_08620 [Streptomyces sp. UP1A-1]|nr:hypothetical protein [Streptomyces sp. UP1A-1]
MTDEAQPPDLSGLPEALVPLITAMLAHAPEDRPALAEVTEQCVALMKDAGFTPVEARYALIDVAAPFGGGDGRTGPSPAVWERIAVQHGNTLDVHTQVVDEDGADSPLDRPARPDPVEDEEQAGSSGAERADEPSTVPEVVPSGDGAGRGDTPRPAERTPVEPPRRPGRKPASQKVAEELRARYAMQAAL